MDFPCLIHGVGPLEDETDNHGIHFFFQSDDADDEVYHKIIQEHRYINHRIDFLRARTLKTTTISMQAGSKEQKARMYQRDEQGTSSNTTNDNPTDAEECAKNDNRETEQCGKRGGKLDDRMISHDHALCMMRARGANYVRIRPRVRLSHFSHVQITATKWLLAKRNSSEKLWR